MTGNEYQKLAQRTSNKILHGNWKLLEGALGLCGESGEVADYIKKAFFHHHNFDRKHVIEELGDVLWYVAEIASEIACDMDTIMEMNIAKLKKRYPEGFSAERSINREEV